MFPLGISAGGNGSANGNGGHHNQIDHTTTLPSLLLPSARPPPSSNPPAAAAAAAAPAVREQDRFMPIANVIRIMRKVLPTHAKISDDAKETIQECVSEYISFITSEANERCQQEQRKTITAEDVLWAMSKLGFDDYIEPLTVYLHRYREVEGDHRGSIRGENLPPIKRGPLPPPPPLEMGHLYGPPMMQPPQQQQQHYHGHYHPGMFAGGLMGGGGFYRGDVASGAGTSHGGGGVGPSNLGLHPPPPPPPPPHHPMPTFDPYNNGPYK